MKKHLLQVMLILLLAPSMAHFQNCVTAGCITGPKPRPPLQGNPFQIKIIRNKPVVQYKALSC